MNKFVDIKKETECRENFKRILFDLSKSQEVLQSPSERANIYLRLEKLYHDSDFRHYYSDIFSVLTSVQQDCTLGDINILGQNLEIIRKGYQPKNIDDSGNLVDISNQLKKLYDHVSLDIARITYSDAADYRLIQNENINNIKSQINLLQEQIEQSNNSIKESNRVVEKTHRKVANSQKEYIAILGIFASIVLTFIGGIAFSTSVLQNIHNASIYRIVLITLLIGLVLIDVIYFLFHFIERLVRNNHKQKAKLLYILNAIMIILILLTVIGWELGLVENRNKSIESIQSSYSVTQETIIETTEETKIIKNAN